MRLREQLWTHPDKIEQAWVYESDPGIVYIEWDLLNGLLKAAGWEPAIAPEETNA